VYTGAPSPAFLIFRFAGGLFSVLANNDVYLSFDGLYPGGGGPNSELVYQGHQTAYLHPVPSPGPAPVPADPAPEHPEPTPGPHPGQAPTPQHDGNGG
jgi:hypothetical protein